MDKKVEATEPSVGGGDDGAPPPQQQPQPQTTTADRTPLSPPQKDEGSVNPPDKSILYALELENKLRKSDDEASKKSEPSSLSDLLPPKQEDGADETPSSAITPESGEMETDVGEGEKVDTLTSNVPNEDVVTETTPGAEENRPDDAVEKETNSSNKNYPWRETTDPEDLPIADDLISTSSGEYDQTATATEDGVQGPENPDHTAEIIEVSPSSPEVGDEESPGVEQTLPGDPEELKGEQTEVLQPNTTDQLNESRPETNVQLEESPPKAKREVELNSEILFDDSSANIPTFDDGSGECNQKRVQGDTNQRWIAADKVLIFTAPVLRATPGKYFWSSVEYKKRILAVYNNPEVMLILRLPADKDEVRRLLPIKGDLDIDMSDRDRNAFLVAESVVDSKMCKIQLSQLTHPTSVPSQGQRGSSWRRSCFDILTPTEVVTLSTTFLPDESEKSLNDTLRSLNDTLRIEAAVVSALMNAHSSNVILHNETWKHQIVLGTVHSSVISGNDQKLKESLDNAIKMQTAQSVGSGTKGETNVRPGVARVDSTIIDARDGEGKTALYYACSRRKNSTVQILVSAGANCTQVGDDLTPSHICAKNLDEKSLSVVLSAKTRPDPNALDCQGRTPSYLAAVEGCTPGNNRATALDLCLSALEAWGGQLMIDSPKSNNLLHPVHCLSAQWKADELSVLLSHCDYHYPLPIKNGSHQCGISLSATFHYPIHAAIISLRKKIFSIADDACDEFKAQYVPLEPEIVKTIRTLLEHGVEPNERFEGIAGKGEEFRTLSRYIGCSPIHILAMAAIDANAINGGTGRGGGEHNAETIRSVKNVMKVIQATADELFKNGARINLEPPMRTRLDRVTPAGCYPYLSSVSSIHIAHREGLKIEKNDEIVTLLGGGSRISTCQNAFIAMGKRLQGALTVGSSSLDSSAPGGSDSNSCAICWSEFGVISNRKHLCRVSCRYVCNDCSSKRMVLGSGSEQRVSDGQFLLAKSEARKADERIKAAQQEHMRKQRRSVTKARVSLGLEDGPDSSSSGSKVGAKESKVTAADKITNVISGLGQMRNAVVERGSKLESLADKTEALNNASLDFANMAKELERSQNSWW